MSGPQGIDPSRSPSRIPGIEERDLHGGVVDRLSSEQGVGGDQSPGDRTAGWGGGVDQQRGCVGGGFGEHDRMPLAGQAAHGEAHAELVIDEPAPETVNGDRLGHDQAVMPRGAAFLDPLIPRMQNLRLQRPAVLGLTLDGPSTPTATHPTPTANAAGRPGCRAWDLVPPLGPVVGLDLLALGPINPSGPEHLDHLLQRLVVDPGDHLMTVVGEPSQDGVVSFRGHDRQPPPLHSELGRQRLHGLGLAGADLAGDQAKGLLGQIPDPIRAIHQPARARPGAVRPGSWTGRRGGSRGARGRRRRHRARRVRPRPHARLGHLDGRSARNPGSMLLGDRSPGSPNRPDSPTRHTSIDPDR